MFRIQIFQIAKYDHGKYLFPLFQGLISRCFVDADPGSETGQVYSITNIDDSDFNQKKGGRYHGKK